MAERSVASGGWPGRDISCPTATSCYALVFAPPGRGVPQGLSSQCSSPTAAESRVPLYTVLVTAPQPPTPYKILRVVKRRLQDRD